MKKLLLILIGILFIACDGPMTMEKVKEEVKAAVKVETEEVVKEEVAPKVEEAVKKAVETLQAEPEPVVYENHFCVSPQLCGGETTPLSLDGSLLTYDGTDYNIETMTPNVYGVPVRTHVDGNKRTISVLVKTSKVDFSLFINDNLAAHEIDCQDMCEADFKKLIGLLYKEEIIYEPEFTSTRYALSCQLVGGDGQSLQVSHEAIGINKEYKLDDDYPFDIRDKVKTIKIFLKVDVNDFCFFINDNMKRDFGIDLQSMTREELKKAALLLGLHPEKNMIELREEYGR